MRPSFVSPYGASQSSIVVGGLLPRVGRVAASPMVQGFAEQI